MGIEELRYGFSKAQSGLWLAFMALSCSSDIEGLSLRDAHLVCI